MNEHAIDDDIKDGWILIGNKKGVWVRRKTKPFHWYFEAM